VRGRALLIVAAPLLLAGCVKNLATSAVADALSGSGGVYGQDPDPELVQDAIPFALKTMEGVLVEQPEHIGLLTALTSGFVQYGYAFVEQEAHRIEDDDFDRAEALRSRAAGFYRRALAYGLRGLSVQHADAQRRLRLQPDEILAEMGPEDVPLMYWTAAAWGLVIGSSNLDPESVANLPTVMKIAQRALQLDPAWNDGTLYELMLSLQTAAPGGSLEAAEAAYETAVQLSGGRRAGAHVSYAENVCVKRQDGPGFLKALKQAMAVDVEAHIDDRLANVIMQRRARRVLARADDLFVEDIFKQTSTSTSTEGTTP